MPLHLLRVNSKALTVVYQSLTWSDILNSLVLPGPLHSSCLCSLCSCHMGFLAVPDTDKSTHAPEPSTCVPACFSSADHVATPSPLSDLVSQRSSSQWGLHSSLFHIAIPPLRYTPHAPSLLHFLHEIYHHLTLLTLGVCICVYVCAYMYTYTHTQAYM